MRDASNRHRLQRQQVPSVRKGGYRRRAGRGKAKRDAVVDCGWGRLIMAHTFADHESIAKTLTAEEPGHRDIAMYVANPHELLANDPVSLFLDPSHTYRLWLANYQPAEERPRGFTVRRLGRKKDAAGINRLYHVAGMVPPGTEFIWKHSASRVILYALAVDDRSGDVIGTITGIDHTEAFDDPENGSSFWCLAVDPQSRLPGVGEALVRYVIEALGARGRDYIDLSVMHDNRQAIALYEKLGFQRIATFCVKHKNPINVPLFAAPDIDEKLNPYAMIIVDEARRRGIKVEVIDAEEGYFRLEHAGQSVVCRESLSELTTAVAMSRCENKRVTLRLLSRLGLSVPEQREAGSDSDNLAFLKRHERLVVKPVTGEQGAGVSVDITDAEQLNAAIDEARRFASRVVLERFRPGEDLRVIVINYEVVAAAVRRPPFIVGTGRHKVKTLIEKQSRRRAAATGGESRIPVDAETRRCLARAGLALDDVPAAGREIMVRSTANLHTGGTIEDVTPRLHPELAEASERAARALDIPVVGLDLIVESPEQPEYVIIEANERPGLANHEPQPTAERFVDLLFPLTASPD